MAPFYTVAAFLVLVALGVYVIHRLNAQESGRIVAHRPGARHRPHWLHRPRRPHQPHPPHTTEAPDPDRTGRRP